MPENRTCPHCRAVVRVEMRPLAVRDKDSLACPCCSEELMSWNCSAAYGLPVVVSGPQPDPSLQLRSVRAWSLVRRSTPVQTPSTLNLGLALLKRSADRRLATSQKRMRIIYKRSVITSA